MSSIFTRLFKYRPSGDRLSREDFFTEAFAGVLKKSRQLQTEFVKWLIHQEDDEVDLKTQKTLDNGGRVDVWIDARNKRRGARHVVAMENKIKAEEGADQLQGYAAELQLLESANSRTVVYATLHERGGLQNLPDGPEVEFQQIHWFQVANWLREWETSPAHGGDDPSIPFARELVCLMEDWRMTLNLKIGDLAAATAYHGPAEDQLRQILSQIEAACVLPGATGRWQRLHSQGYLSYTSPWIDDAQYTKVEFGFDFKRDDDGWSVRQLSLPSAYFAVWSTDQLELGDLQDWQDASADWDANYLRVKQLTSLRIRGVSLHSEYLDFLEEARAELWRALDLGG